ncbi:hypothetical protein [Microbacterium sp. NIBRBAC000506063]|uniref:hypothetical protein n=1 Tax=Microbacterium sp. NIBRBAC000506063 TaxID=2734618 RepID=UPI001BB6F1D5|nr:hypothetical protein [Microbacterium sp. NIBRBAC000506063]QTV80967.1 hypothetical protein KAE78_14650 [Microbacterium sp. NIBRBAC000506063]
MLPEPEPTPTPLFSSEEEAFAAAEEVYRAYIDAMNDSRAGEEDINPNIFLTGVALELDREARATAESMGVRLVGERVVDSIVPVEAVLAPPLQLCK